MRDFPYPMTNRFPVSTFVSPGDDVVWSNAQPPEVEKAMMADGTYEPREYFKGVAIVVHEDHAIVAYRRKPDKIVKVKQIKKPVGDKIEWTEKVDVVWWTEKVDVVWWTDPIPDGELIRVGDPRRDYWFTRTPTSIFYDVLGLPEINAGKLRDLIDFGDSDIRLWNYLGDLTQDRKHLADEVVNFILGPLAAALKAKSSDPTKGGTIYGFRDREVIVSQYSLEVMFEAVTLGLVPKSVRKELDAFMVGGDLVSSDVEHIRVVFYDKLAQLLEVVLAAADIDIGAMVDKVFADNPAQAEKARSDPKLVGWAMGQVMKASPTKLDPNEVRAIIIEKLK